MTDPLTPVAFDVETTGFAVDDRLTVAGFALPLGCRVFLHADGREAERAALEQALTETFETTVELSVHDTERATLSAVSAFGRERLADRDYLLVAYNGERYRGGFDLPFLRSRAARLEVPWPFVELPYADLLPVVRRRFNTVVDGGSGAEERRSDESRSGDGGRGDRGPADLEHAYEVLLGGVLGDLDPFEDSAAAVAAHAEGDFEALLAHNLADVLRTDALASLANRYCSKSSFRVENLTPTVPDPPPAE